MLDAADRAGTCAAIVAADLNDVGVCLGNATRHNTNASLSHQLDRHLTGGDDEGPHRHRHGQWYKTLHPRDIKP